MILPALKGRGLFVFSDPGGAKPVLSIVENVKNELDDYLIISDREYPFYCDFSVKVTSFCKSPEEIVASFSPDFILTGTSYTSTIELDFLEAAGQMNVPAYSFVDHWTNIRERFLKDGKEIFPDYILLIDEEARSIAIENKIPSLKIIVVGNPYHDFLKKWKPSIPKTELYHLLNLTYPAKKIIVYAPDPLSNVAGLQQLV